MSVVIPAYNEAARLPRFLREVRTRLSHEFGADYEVVVVDDGGRDELERVLQEEFQGWPQLSVLRFERNRGKGAAVRSGMAAARGELLLFADADGATPIEEEASLRAAILAGADLAIGSRFAPAAVERRRSPIRGLAGRAFARFARHVLALEPRDLQCGFKMFPRRTAKTLFALCQEDGYLLDAELLCLAKKFGLAVVEIGVRWTEVPGSRVRPLQDAWRMLWGLLFLRRRLGRSDELSARD